MGFIIQYRPGKANVVRVNTRSLSTAPGLNDDNGGSNNATPPENNREPLPNSQEQPAGSKFLAFKAPAARSSLVSDKDEIDMVSERQLVENICHEISRTAKRGGGSSSSTFEVEASAIVSAKEARDSTGLIEHWTHSLKRLVWG